MDEDTECDSFGVDDELIFYYLGSNKLSTGNFCNEFYVHSVSTLYGQAN